MPTTSPHFITPPTKPATSSCKPHVNQYIENLHNLPVARRTRKRVVRRIFQAIDDFVEDCGIPYDDCQHIYKALLRLFDSQEVETDARCVSDFIVAHNIV